MPLRWYHDRFTLAGRRLRIPVAHGQPPLWVRLDRHLPYPPEQIRSVTLVFDAGRLWVDVTAEVPVACYRAGQEPDLSRAAGVDLGIIHPYAVAGPDGQALLVSGRAIRAEHRMHLADSKARQKAVARRAPKPGQKGSPGRGPAPPAGPPGPARSRQNCHHLGRRPQDRHAGRRRPTRRAKPGRRAAAQSAHPRLAHRPPDRCAQRQGRDRRDQPDPDGRARHLVHLPRLRQPRAQAHGPPARVPRLRAYRPP